MSVWSLWLHLSWPFLVAIACQIAQPSLGFWRLFIQRVWRPFGRSFKRIWWRERRLLPKAGLWDRLGQHWMVVDVDGTRQAARQRALPQLESLPHPHRRFDQVAAPGYVGRKRGEVVRTRTTLLQAHSHQWMWNLRLELGQHLSPTEMRLTEFAPAPATEPAPAAEPAEIVLYGPPHWARLSFDFRFSRNRFYLATRWNPALPRQSPPLPSLERRPARDGSYRLLYAARIGDCRSCLLRPHCQESSFTTKPRRVSAVFWPVSSNNLWQEYVQ